ncbi:MAG: hypothetical protein WCP53_00100, partial [Verrucomicrobiota bacterium]
RDAGLRMEMERARAFEERLHDRYEQNVHAGVWERDAGLRMEMERARAFEESMHDRYEQNVRDRPRGYNIPGLTRQERKAMDRATDFERRHYDRFVRTAREQKEYEEGLQEGRRQGALLKAPH